MHHALSILGSGKMMMNQTDKIIALAEFTFKKKSGNIKCHIDRKTVTKQESWRK